LGETLQGIGEVLSVLTFRRKVKIASVVPFMRLRP
jgi:hypothetical protein